VYRSSGITLSEWQARQKASENTRLPGDQFQLVQMAICPQDRAVLHTRIASRFELMMRAGMLAEVAGLRARGNLHTDLPALRAVGYRQLWGHLNGDYSLDEGVQKAIAATRQLAKRQLTWLRKWPELKWIVTDTAGKVVKNEWPENLEGEKTPLQLALNYLRQAPI
jgi:tRNA dimethylallyltransferase